MILLSSTPEYILSQMNEDCQWNDRMMVNIWNKYRNTIKKISDGKVFHTVKYTTPNHNTMYVVYYREDFNNSIGIGRCFFFVVEGRLITPVTNTVSKKWNRYIFYTSHALDRVLTRSGIDMMTFIKTFGSTTGAKTVVIPYTYKGRDSFLSPFGNKGGFLCVKEDWGWTAVTYIDIGIMGNNQVALQNEGIKAADQLVEEDKTTFAPNLTNVPRNIRRQFSL